MTATIHTPYYYVELARNIDTTLTDQYVVLFGSEEPWWDGKIYHTGTFAECEAEAKRLNGNN